MKTTMEENKETSQHVYEDEYVILTQNNELFLKGDERDARKKLCEVSPEDLEEKLSELRDAFSKLQSKVEETLAGDITLEDLAALEDDINSSNAVGDYSALKEQIEEKKLGLAESETDDTSAEEEKGEEAPEVAEDEAELEQDDGSPAPEASETKAEEVEAQEEKADEEVEEVADEETEEVEAEVEQDEESTTESEAEEQQEVVGEDEADEEASEEESPLDYYKEIVTKAQELAKQNDWSYVSVELDNLSHRWAEGPDADDDEQVKKLYKKFSDIVDDFEERKEQHYDDLEKKKQENLETKKELLKEFEGIVSNETWTATRRVNQMKGQWKSTGPLPNGKGEELDNRFEELLDVFNDHKVDRLVQKRQEEEDNLMLKLTVLEKMENVTESMTHETENWDEIEEKFEDLTKQWKKIGRVPKEKSNEVWDRYKSAQDEYYDRKYKYDPDHQSKVDKFTHKKEKIIEEADYQMYKNKASMHQKKDNPLIDMINTKIKDQELNIGEMYRMDNLIEMFKNEC